MSSSSCPHCGETHPEEAQFCPNTGRPISKAEMLTPTIYNVPSPSKSSSRSVKKVFGIVGLALVLIVGGWFIGRYMMLNVVPPLMPLAATPISTQASPKDGMVMVYVPDGPFTMGSDNGGNDEKPIHTITLSAFWIDKTEVTNKMYALCVASGACSPPYGIESKTRNVYYGDTQYNNYPVINVAWQDANAYCRWAGRRLPTEAEWEKAARGTDSRIYPWGNASPDGSKLNFDNDKGDTSEVGNYPSGASPYGALDMAGNVMEWVNDWYEETYYSKSPSQNPTGPVSGLYHTLRGGAYDSGDRGMRTSNRGRTIPGPFATYVGFRCVSSH